MAARAKKKPGAARPRAAAKPTPKALKTPKPSAASRPAGAPFAERRPWNGRAVLAVVWLGALLWFIGLALYPPSTAFTRMSGVILAGVLPVLLLVFCWPWRVPRWGLAVLYAGVAGFWLLPGRFTYDRLSLRARTAHALGRYEGVRVYPEGENTLGIDATGLIRRGAVDAALQEGFRTNNPLLVRKAVEIWWRDLGARELSAGARKLARRLVQVKSINAFDDSLLHPGDFAITDGATHALAYLGDHLWIEADPDEGKVIKLHGRTTSNPWFGKPASIMRWRFLEAPRSERR